MRLCDWFSDARVIEREAGWPRPLAMRVARTVSHRHRHRDLLLALLTALLCFGSPLALALLLESAPRRWAQITLVTVSAAIVVCWFWAGRVLVRARLRRDLAAFLAAPSCLKCRYPVVPGAKEQRSVCPECGEPIPPEIAGLVAERAK